MKVDVNDIRAWPPGALMMFDNTKIAGTLKHVGLGIVVANDGCKLIDVMWDASCFVPFMQYDVPRLNPRVISRVG